MLPAASRKVFRKALLEESPRELLEALAAASRVRQTRTSPTNPASTIPRFGSTR